MSFKKLVIIQTKYTSRHPIDISRAQEASGYKKLLTFMPFRMHQFESILTIVTTFQKLQPEMHESYDLDFIKFEQTLFKIHFRAKL